MGVLWAWARLDPVALSFCAGVHPGAVVVPVSCRAASIATATSCSTRMNPSGRRSPQSGSHLRGSTTCPRPALWHHGLLDPREEAHDMASMPQLCGLIADFPLTADQIGSWV